MGKLRRIHVSIISDMEEKEVTYITPDFLSDTIRGYTPIKSRKISLRFEDEYGDSYIGLFEPGKEPHLGEAVDLEYSGIISAILCMDNVEDDKGQRFVYRKLN